MLIKFCFILLLSSSSAFATLSAGVNKPNRSSIGSKRLIIISTVDGRISALDLKKEGKLMWSVDLNNGPLISSSITKLVYEQNGKTVRLIPSLQGNLYKFNGDFVEAVPFDADQLLRSSFRLAENTVLVGGKETGYTGIDATSGNILYSCSVKGCNQEQAVQDTNDVFVVKRLQQTVRSIENRNGAENWNYSVSELDVEFSKGSEARLLSGTGDQQPPTSEDYVFGQAEEDSYFDMSDLSQIKFVVPDGTVCMVTPKNKKLVLWKHKFTSAIASAWVLSDSHLQKINMFDVGKVPALGKDSNANSVASDVIYMGVHEKQMYIQASPSVQQAVIQSMNSNLQTSVGHVKYNPPRFTQRPCISSSKYLTSTGSEIGDDGRKDNSLAVQSDQELIANNLGKLLLLCHDDPALEQKGIYFQGDLSIYSRIQRNSRKGRNTITTDETNVPKKANQVEINQNTDYSFKTYVLTIALMIFVPYFVYCYVNAVHVKSPIIGVDPTKYDANDNAQASTLLAPSASEYESRFLQDFEPEKCLGRGGFGVVFKARNKMDDCSYAVKRILLPQSKMGRDKVLREVKTLAQLDHRSIVRYFNSWSEQPPAEWQKAKDELLINDLSAWGSATPRTTDRRLSSETSNGKDENRSQFSNGFTQPTIGENEEKDGALNQINASQGFFNSNWNEDKGDRTGFNEDSLSWAETSARFVYDKPVNLKGKFFQAADTSSSASSASSASNDVTSDLSIPFQNYRNDTVSVVFDEEAKDGLAGKTASHNHSAIPAPSLLIEDKANGSGDHDNTHATVYLYIQMQLCREESLKEWLLSHLHTRQRPEYIKIFKQVVDAVKYIHDQELIHRDLKPSNVLFSLEGDIKVGDFGLVTRATDLPSEPSKGSDDAVDKQHTHDVGTTLYMAPEQVNSGNYTGKVDIFALGLILFELVCPFSTQMEKVRHFTNARRFKFPPDLKRDHVQEATLITCMLQRDADMRPTATAIREDELFRKIPAE